MRFSRHFMDKKEAWGFRIASWWRGVGGQLSREEHAELQQALRAARDDFLRWERPESWTSDAMEMRKLRGLLGRMIAGDHPPINTMNDLQVARAICEAIKRGSLLFVPSREDVERYLEEERKRRRNTARSGDSPTPDPLVLNATSTQSALTTPLSSAQPFTYQPDMPDDDTIELAGSEGRPRNNFAQNKQTNDVARILRLSPDQARQLHHELGGEPPMGFHEIMERAKDMFNLW